MEDSMAAEVKYMDAGKSTEATEAVPATASPTKYYPRLCIDLDQFPELKAEVDEVGDLSIRFRVCSVRHNDYCHEMELEVTSIGVPKSGDNEADKAYEKLRSKPRY
jgi:hypothetical protein